MNSNHGGENEVIEDSPTLPEFDGVGRGVTYGGGIHGESLLQSDCCGTAETFLRVRG